MRMEEEKPTVALLNNLVKTKNYYKEDFLPKKEDRQQIARIMKIKLKTQYQDLISIMEKVQEKNKLKEKNTTPKKDQKNISKSQDKNKQLYSTVLAELTTPQAKSVEIKQFEKYEQNLMAKEQSNGKQQDRLALSNKMEMNLMDSTKLGTIKASSLRRLIKPRWHPPFQLYGVIAGHQGWIRSIAVSPCNGFFVTGSTDRTIKFWDMASKQLKITLTGHINTVRGLQFSKFHPYLFSCGEDKSVKCWDLEMNKVIRNYHGHLSGVYCLKMHHALSVLVTGGRDSTARVWDVRVRKQIHALVGHAHTVGSVATQDSQPHVITGSYDSFIKLWDIGQGKCIQTLTNHKKSVRAIVQHPNQYTFASAASDNIKVWKCPNGQFLRNISGHNSILNALVINQEGILVSGGDDGTMKFWDWASGYNYFSTISQPQPGSIAAENGIFALAFDQSGSRLISGQCDKTIKLWKQNENATEQTHPIKQFMMEFERN